jgi:hypothetical protein
MMVIRAQYDGRAFVPVDPVECLPGATVRLMLLAGGDDAANSDTQTGGLTSGGIEPPLAGLARLAEAWPNDANWPPDGTVELDHYLYGLPKRGSA